MKGSFTPHLVGMAVFAFVMSFIFGSAALRAPGSASVSVPVSLAFSTMGLLAAWVAAALRQIHQRLARLEDGKAATQVDSAS